MSYGVAVGGKRWFVKGAVTSEAVASLRRAVQVHASVRHPAIVPLERSIALRGGLALVYPWVEGEVLYHPTTSRKGGRAAPGSPIARFRRLPVPDVLMALERILDAHVTVRGPGLSLSTSTTGHAVRLREPSHVSV